MGEFFPITNLRGIEIEAFGVDARPGDLVDGT